MKLATTLGEKKLSDLTARLFDIKGAGSKDASKKAEAALLAANPHLSDLSKVPAGTPIVVPDTAPSKEGTTFQPVQMGIAQIAVQSRQFATLAQAGLQTSIANEIQRLNTLNEGLKSKEVKNLASKDASIQDSVTAAVNDNKVRLKQLDQINTVQAQAFKDLSADLDALLKQFGGG